MCGSIGASVTKSRVRCSHAFAVAATRLGYNVFNYHASGNLGYTRLYIVAHIVSLC